MGMGGVLCVTAVFFFFFTRFGVLDQYAMQKYTNLGIACLLIHLQFMNFNADGHLGSMNTPYFIQQMRIFPASEPLPDRGSMFTIKSISVLHPFDENGSLEFRPTRV